MSTTTRPRPRSLPSTTTKLQTEYGNLYVTVSTDEDGEPFEVFGWLGKGGSFQHGVTELACRLISLHMRRGTPLEEVIDQCQGIQEMQPFFNTMPDGKSVAVLGLGDGIAHILTCIDREAVWDRMNAHGFSQNEVARRAGISSANLSQIMNGRNNPSPGVLKRLHGVLFQPTKAERVMPAEVKVLGWRKGERSGMVVHGAGGPGRRGKFGGPAVRVGGRVPWGAKAEFAYRAGYDGTGRLSVTHIVERGYSAMLTGIPQIKPTFLDIAPSGIPSNIIPHSKGVKCGLIRSNSPFSYSNHRPAKPKIPKPLVYAQVSPLGTSFATP